MFREKEGPFVRQGDVSIPILLSRRHTAAGMYFYCFYK